MLLTTKLNRLSKIELRRVIDLVLVDVIIDDTRLRFERAVYKVNKEKKILESAIQQAMKEAQRP